MIKLNIIFSPIKELSRHVRFIRVEEATSLILNHESVDEPLVAFTFDDGFMECHSMIAPVLEQFGVNAAFLSIPILRMGMMCIFRILQIT